MANEIQSRSSFDAALARSHEHLVVIDFFATWCPPCVRIAPLFQQLAEEIPDVKFFKLDVDQVSDVARSEAIRAMPTFKFYRGGRCEETIQGGSVVQLRAAIERLRPPPPLLEPVLDLASATGPEARREAGNILVRIAGNVLREPLNPKFRRLKISNQIVTEKLLVVDGAMQCLIAMGFRDTDDAFVLDPEKALDDVRLVKSQIERIVLSEEGATCGKGDAHNSAPSLAPTPTPNLAPIPGPTPATLPDPAPLPAPSCAPDPLIIHQKAQFQNKIEKTLEMVKIYEKRQLQEKARIAMDWEAFSSRIDVANTYNLVQELLAWFKNDFFSWTDAPSCPSCERKPQPVGRGEPNLSEMEGWASYVELYRCLDHGEIRFPRFNHPGRLLETRTGRCGEWANAFMLVLRAAGVRSRYVLDWTDHVWCEVFIGGRWVHCDPCEAALDKPLMYEVGWGKKLSYIFAFQLHDIQDVTWRYTQKTAEVMTRRSEVPEDWLVSAILSARTRLHQGLALDERERRAKENLMELVELLSPPRSAQEDEQIGRQSGSKEWREQRGELGASKEVGDGAIIRPSESELKVNRLEFRYSCAKDLYERPLADQATLQTAKGWRVYATAFKNLARKHENDWKMVYLARPEGCPSNVIGYIEWSFDLEKCGRRLQKVKIMTAGAEFDSGVVKFTLCGDNGKCTSVRGLFVNDTIFRGCQKVTLRAEVQGGNGHLAFQHAQLFRQKETDNTLFPLNVVLEFQDPEKIGSQANEPNADSSESDCQKIENCE